MERHTLPFPDLGGGERAPPPPSEASVLSDFEMCPHPAPLPTRGLLHSPRRMRSPTRKARAAKIDHQFDCSLRVISRVLTSHMTLVRAQSSSFVP